MQPQTPKPRISRRIYNSLCNYFHNSSLPEQERDDRFLHEREDSGYYNRKPIDLTEELARLTPRLRRFGITT